MVLGDPHVVEAGLLGCDRSRNRGFQHGGVVLAGELGGEQERPESHGPPPSAVDVSGPAPPNPMPTLTTGWSAVRSSGLWLSSWPRAEMNAW